MIRGLIDGIVVVLLAIVVGLAIAFSLGALGLTDTSFWRLALWLAGAGLLGGWQQTVTSDVADGVGWDLTATGAPLLVTGAVIVYVSLRARRATLPSGVAATAGAALAALLLVLISSTSVTVTNSAGSVTTQQGLTWWWTDLRPGTITGAALLVLGTWAVNTVGLSWWRTGRGPALSVVIVLGFLLSLVTAFGGFYLTSSTAIGVAVVILYPLLGTLILLGLVGVPATASLTRISPEPIDFTAWSAGFFVGVGALVAALLLMAIVGLILRVVGHRSTWLGASTVTAALMAFVCWAMSTTIAVPAGLGADTRVTVNLVAAVVAGAVLGALVRYIAGHPRPTAQAEPAIAPEKPAAGTAESVV